MSVSRKLLEASIKGAATAETTFQRIKQSFNRRLSLKYVYKPRPDDIFLVTFPKSGTTMMQMMLHQMTTNGEMDFSHINSISPWFERHLLAGRIEWFEKLPSPRFFKSHMLYEKTPLHGKLIYMVRDVRDVAVSAYYHQRVFMHRQGDVASFVDDFLDDRVGFGSWFEHVESWWLHRNDPNVLFLRYEEVVADLAGTVRKVAGFCSIPLDEAELPRIVERCSFEYMKKHNDKFDPRLHSTYVGDFIRSGKAGEGHVSFTPEQNRRLAEQMDKLAARLGRSPADADAPFLLPQAELNAEARG